MYINNVVQVLLENESVSDFVTGVRKSIKNNLSTYTVYYLISVVNKTHS